MADRLGKEACDGLKAEETGLVTAGAKADMEQGPEWARANLTPERLQQIARLIDIQEQLAFRCRAVPAVPIRKKGKPGAKGGATATHAAVPADNEPVAKPGVALETERAPLKPKPAATGAAVAPIETNPEGAAAPVSKPAVIKLKPPPPGAPAGEGKPAAKKKAAPAAKVKKSPAQSTGLFSFD